MVLRSRSIYYANIAAINCAFKRKSFMQLTHKLSSQGATLPLFAGYIHRDSLTA